LAARLATAAPLVWGVAAARAQVALARVEVAAKAMAVMWVVSREAEEAGAGTLAVARVKVVRVVARVAAVMVVATAAAVARVARVARAADMRVVAKEVLAAAA
jgi:hypothetical protein